MNTKKIKRRTIWRAFNKDWCLSCGKVVDMEYVPNIKGTPITKCPECFLESYVELLKSGDDLIEVPSNYKVPK